MNKIAQSRPGGKVIGSPSVSRPKTSKLKEQFIEVLRKNAGNIKLSCENAGISRSTYYNWIDDDKDFEKAVSIVNEEMIDFAESELLKKITDGNLTAIIFYLKTKGQSRGYIEKQYINQKQLNVPIKVFELDEIIIE